MALTRHPNYSGDACVWWGLFLVSCGSWLGLVTIFSPLLMTYLLAAGSGKPITEGQLAQRPGYAEYVARTSGFSRARRALPSARFQADWGGAQSCPPSAGLPDERNSRVAGRWPVAGQGR